MYQIKDIRPYIKENIGDILPHYEINALCNIIIDDLFNSNRTYEILNGEKLILRKNIKKKFFGKK